MFTPGIDIHLRVIWPHFWIMKVNQMTKKHHLKSYGVLFKEHSKNETFQHCKWFFTDNVWVLRGVGGSRVKCAEFSLCLILRSSEAGERGSDLPSAQTPQHRWVSLNNMLVLNMLNADLSLACNMSWSHSPLNNQG